MSEHDKSLPQQHSDSERWIGYELHDGLLQWLISARMGLESTLCDLEPNQFVLDARLRHTLVLVQNALEEGRELIGFLEPSEVTSEHSFASCLARFIEQVEGEARSRGQNLDYRQADPEWTDLPRRTSWNLLRIAQEAVRNALRHAGECNIRIECGWKNPETLSLIICDDGHGFQPQATSSATMHFGLSSMEHRAKLIGAEFELDSEVGSGTSIRLSLPLAK